MKDIETKEDIDRLMVKFYERAIGDDVIGYIFTEVARLDLEHHLPVVGDFWETLLFGTGNYQSHGRSPLQVHARLSQESPLKFEISNAGRKFLRRSLMKCSLEPEPILRKCEPTLSLIECSTMSTTLRRRRMFSFNRIKTRAESQGRQ